MCFSMTASFAASSVLLASGAVAVAHARKLPSKYFAAIPLLFGIQQGIEGLQWLVDKPSAESIALGYGFLFFAFLVWPFYTPFSVMMMEKNKKRKNILTYLTGFGALGSLYLLGSYLFLPLEVEVVHNSICYDIAVPGMTVGMPLYVFSVCSSLFSTHWRAKLLGITTFIGFVITVLMYHYAFTSVWCFFAAALSVVVLAEIFADSSKKKHAKSIS